jgi:hypothetical protein
VFDSALQAGADSIRHGTESRSATRTRSALRAAGTLSFPFLEEAAFLDLALDLIRLKRALSLKVQLTLHCEITAPFGLHLLLFCDRPIDELIAGNPAKERTADDARRVSAAAAEHRAECTTGRGAAEGPERRLGRRNAAAGDRFAGRDERDEA